MSAADRSEAIKLIDEAVSSGAHLSKTCERIGITERTYYRWKKLNTEYASYEYRRAHVDHTNPSNKLSCEERTKIIDTCCSEKYAV
ncbi:helix-turn-helix domain-containing protein (plasmid) [Lachnospiraceae bacterium C1.1]